MATIRRIDNIEPIEGADAIMVATVGGWKSVIKKEEFKIGDLAIYLEVDSWCPHEYKPELSKGKEPRVYDGIKGERLKTIRLRGQISQGLLLPVSVGIDAFVGSKFDDGQELSEVFFEGNDVSEILNIQKYEPPVSAQLAGMARGNFPSRIPKTDQERIQNLTKELAHWKEKGFTWSVSEKCEGSSHTAYIFDGEFGVCSRNLDLQEDENNIFWKTAIKYDLKNKLMGLNRNLAIQSEILGPGIQGNIYQLKDHVLVVFDVYDIDKQEYLYPIEKKTFIEQIGLTSVPVLDSAYSLNDKTIGELLSFAEGKSIMGITGCEREGLVFDCNECHASFKAISNQYLIKQKD